MASDRDLWHAVDEYMREAPPCDGEDDTNGARGDAVTVLVSGQPAQTYATVGQLSDGYHTFDELYAHRIALFIALARSHTALAWRCILHADGSRLHGWFITGMHLPTGDISYHLPLSEWERLDGIAMPERAPEWDGHTPADVVDRLRRWAETLA